MNNVKTRSQDAMTVYHAYWESYLKGDMETMATFIADEFQVIGTTESEVFLDKQETMRFYDATSDQVAGKVELRNRDIRQKQNNGAITVTEFSDAYILVDDEWVFYAKFRITSLLQQKKDGWKFVQQHGSIPDSRAEEGEQVASEKIRQENLELRDAVKRRTVELETKNRELEIEAALEKVRTVAMAMRERKDMPDVCKTIALQLQALGVKEIRNVQTAIFYKERANYMNYEYYAKHKKTIITETDYSTNETHHEFALKMMKGKGEFFYTQITDLKEWLAYQKTTNVFIDTYLEKASSLNYYWFSLGPVALGISTYITLAEEEMNLFLRFMSVFELAYRRFLDIEKAEAQAREAEIELTLEHVRSRTMAMQHSDELLEASDVMFAQLEKLQINALRTGICTIDPKTGAAEIWSRSEQKEKTQNSILGVVPFGTHPVFDGMVKAWRDKKTCFISERVGDEVKEYYAKVAPYLSYPVPIEYNERESISTFFFKEGSLNVISLEPLKEEDHRIMIRFARAFGQMYTRFRDLQKAETQARKAQIEASLERVRSLALGMHRSEEVGKVSDGFFSEFNKLTMKILGCSIVVIDEKKDSMELWRARSSVVVKPFDRNSFSNSMKILKKNLPDWYLLFIDALKKKNNYLMDELSGEKRIKFINAMAEQNYSKEEKKQLFKLIPEHFVAYFIYFKLGYLALVAEEKLPEENLAIARRFVDVFGFAYTRFLDIKKAEEQAREAQIETALERVRAKAMAMHNSDDLAQTVDAFFKELKKLDVTPRRCGVTLIDKETHIADLTVTTAKGQNKDLKMTGKLTLAGHPVLDEVYNNWKRQKEYHPVLNGPQIKEYYNAMNPEIEYPDSSNDETQYGHYFYFKEGGVFAWTDKELPESSLNIFRKFTSVLSLTYRRYLDLIEAEAQAKEAQIEAALERVRAKTMAMHKSDELAETAAVVFKQLIQLGIEPNRIYIAIIKDDKGTVEFWITDEDGSKVSSGFTANLNNNISFKKMLTGWQEQKKSCTIDMKGKELRDYFKHLSSLGVPFKSSLAHKRRMQYIAYFSQGFIGVASPDETKPETLQLLERFAAVFNLTYTRFNDLLQAEAQNKIIRAENERKTKELEEARKMQLSMLPEELPQIPHLDIAVYMKTATEVGGDYYDFVTHEDGSLNICLGDATGHGMKAGIMVSSMKSIFTTNAPKMGIEQFFETANVGIKSMNLMHMMMGMVMVNINSKSFKLINAGMPPVFFYSSKSGSIHEIKEHGMPVGAMRLSNYKIIDGSLQKGDVLLLLSDGMPELADKNNEMFGYNRLVQTFNTVTEKKPEEIIDHLKHVAAQWADNKDPDDDVTFVIIKVRE